MKNINKNKELIKNTIIIFIGKFSTQFISFLLIPIYTNFLETSNYGYIDLVQVYISLLVPIIFLRFDSGIFRFLIDERNNDNGKKIIISNTFFFIILQTFLFMLIVFILNYFFKITYVIMITINIIMIAISNIFLQLTRGIGDNIGYSIASILTGIVTIVLNIFLIIIMKFDGISILVATAIANLLCSIYLIFRNKIFRYINIKNINNYEFKKMLKYCLPMIPDGLSWWVVNASDRTIISWVINASANGIYAISSKFSNIMSAFIQIFNMSWQESASLHINDKDSKEFFSNVLNVTYKLFFSILIIVMVCMPIIFNFIIGKDYKSAYLYVPILLLGNLYNAMSNVIGGIYIAKKNTKQVARTTMLAAIINIIINLILIKKFGLYAAAVSTLISYIILTLYRYIDVQKIVKVKFDYKIIIITSILFIFSCLLYYINNIFLDIVNIIYVVGISTILNMNMLKKIFNKLIKNK